MDTFVQVLEQAPASNGLWARGRTSGSCESVTAVPIKPKTFAICDTQPLTSIGIRSVVADAADLRLLVAVDSLEAARVVVQLHAPDVIVIDKAFGDKAILEWLRRTRPRHSRSRVVIWGVSFTRNQVLGLVRAGALGILRKTAPTPTVLDCIETVASGRTWFDGSAGPGVAGAGQPADFGLTAREEQVAKLVEQGLNNRQIGWRLGISCGTVKVHLKHVLRKTATPDRFGLSLAALQRQLSSDSPAARGRSRPLVGNPRHLGCKCLIGVVGQIPDLPTSSWGDLHHRLLVQSCGSWRTSSVRLLTRAVQCCQRLAPNRDRQGADLDFCNLVLALEDAGFSDVSGSKALIGAGAENAAHGVRASCIIPEPMSFRPELRHEVRTPISEAASLHVFNPLVAGCWGVRAADRSADGLQIIGPHPVSIGALVQVRLANALVLGQVRHCAAAADGFRIGVLIENAMPLTLKGVA